MTLSLSVADVMYAKKKPKAYKAKDAAFAVGGKKGAYFAFKPKSYPLNSQQRKVRDIAHACGIKKGMSKADLQRAMVDCVGPKLRK